MAHILAKRGQQDNVAVYEHYCDTFADMESIDPNEITLGSVCLVLEGENGGLEIYLGRSDKKWVKVSGAANEEEEP